MFLFISLIVPAFLLALAVHVIYFVVKLCTLPFRIHIAYSYFGWIALALVALWLLLILYGNLFGRFHSQIKNIVYENKEIPRAFNGYKIVQISDIHLDGWDGHQKQLSKQIEKINALEPDLICFTGDLVSMSVEETYNFIDILKNLKAKDGVVSVLGNHDYSPYSRQSEEKKAEHLEKLIKIEKEQLGWKLLMNENFILKHERDSIAIIGSENQSVGTHPVVIRGDLPKAMAGTEGLMKILLSHDPSQWKKEVVGHTDIALTLSGHTHAMQMRFFGWTPSVYLYPQCDGLYTQNDQSLYVNIGLGGTLPFRINASPEITLIELKSIE